MALKSHWWWDLSTKDFAELDAESVVAILPVGAVEQHGPHLPVRVDTAVNAGIVARAVELMPPDLMALVLPMMPVGKSDEHLAFPGTLTLSHETLGRVWYELGECVHRAGVRKILFLNSHGGQPQLLEIVCRDLRVKLGMFAVNVMWPRLIDLDALFPPEENRHGIHGGQSETSVMLHLHPELVEMHHAENFVPLSVEIERESQMLGPEAGARFGWQAQDLHPKGACGDATKATAELGRLAVERSAARLIKLIEEISCYPLSRIATHTAFDGSRRG
ncbi:creatininase family protein [Bradyrhizobium neotropicale]|uniref:creatininase family protein n=1 Tax=Bradyrhizobium neotropicale TaxID=1497615 RepID=UPI001AD78DFD|nr:creatininase family protein [Bradyrhizobium neotropicale]MBO4220875.1 creatininase family protein [Bradyrhizobium neotropicale]